MDGRRRNGKVGIALAGGGPLGGIYEIGALVALEEALRGVTLTDLDVYVGVSSGAFVAAGLANGIAPSEMHAMFILDRSHSDPFEPDLLLRPAFGEFARRMMRHAGTDAGRGARLFRRVAYARLRRIVHAADARPAERPVRQRRDRRPIWRGCSASRAAPTTSASSRTSCSSSPPTSTAASPSPFGAPGFDDVPISEAVKASAALPGLYPPARIGGRDYVDGALKKTLHASVALKEGAKLLLCINPLVPYDADLAASAGAKPVRLADRGPRHRAVADLSRPHPLAHARRHGALRQGVPGRRRRAVRAGARRRGHLLRQHVQLRRPAQARRARLSPHALGAAGAAPTNSGPSSPATASSSTARLCRRRSGAAVEAWPDRQAVG